MRKNINFVEMEINKQKELFNKLYNLTGNNYIPKSHYLEYSFLYIGKNISFPVSEYFTTLGNVESPLSEDIQEFFSEQLWIEFI